MEAETFRLLEVTIKYPLSLRDIAPLLTILTLLLVRLVIGMVSFEERINVRHVIIAFRMSG